MSIAGVPFSGAGYGPYRPSSRRGSYWPCGEVAYHHDDLCHLLLTAAQDNAIRALTDFVSDERLTLLQAAIATGTAVELAAKAALVRIEPTLLCERSHVDSLLHLSGKGDQATLPATGLRTLGGLDAFRLCKRLMKEGMAGVGEPAAQRALAVRNAALHLALVDRAELRAAVGDSVRIVDKLVIGIGADRRSFWRVRITHVDYLIAEQQAETELIVTAKVEKAREQLASLKAMLSPELAAAVLAQRSKCLTSSEHEEAVTCPVCDQEAWLICGVERGAPEPDGSDEEWWSVSLTAWPFAFECTVCGLSLEDNELGSFEFPDHIDLEPESVPPPWAEEGFRDWDD